MPVKKNLFGGGFSFSGEIAAWITEFERWYKQDVPNRQISFELYSRLIAAHYIAMAEYAWETNAGYSQQRDLLRSILQPGRTNPDLSRVCTYNALDLISRLSDHSILPGLSSEARELARDTIAKM